MMPCIARVTMLTSSCLAKQESKRSWWSAEHSALRGLSILRTISPAKAIKQLQESAICLLSEALRGSYEGQCSALSATQPEIIARNADYQNLLTVKTYQNTAIFLSAFFRSGNTLKAYATRDERSERLRFAWENVRPWH